jgi:hypothetical protein
MKNCLILIVIGVSLGCTSAQNNSVEIVPELITNSFVQKYPDVKKVYWEKEEANYEGEFTIGKMEKSVVFDGDGNFIEEETEIQVSELPSFVVEYCQKNYTKQKITEAAKIVNAKGEVFYEAELRNGSKEFDVIFNAQGNVVSVGD